MEGLMIDVKYEVTTRWERLSWFEEDKIKEILNKISKTNKNILSKYNSKELTTLFRGEDKNKAIRIEQLFKRIGIDAVVSTREDSSSTIALQKDNSINLNCVHMDKVSNTFDKIFANIFCCIRFAAIFPAIIVSKISKKNFNPRIVYLILAAASFIGLYDATIGFIMSPIYDFAYDYSLKSFLATTAVFIVTAVVKAITSFGVASLTGIGEFVGNILEWLSKGLIALTAQTVLLKIAQQGFLLKYGLLAGFGLGIFESARKIGEKIVILTIFIYILLPIVVAAEAYVFDQTTSPIIENISTEYKKIGSAAGLTKTALLGAGEAILNSVKSFFSGGEDESNIENIEKLKLFFCKVIEGVLYILVSILFLSIISPFISYVLFKHLAKSISNANFDSLLHGTTFQSNMRTHSR